MAERSQTRLRVLLVIAIVGVAAATLVVQQQLTARKADRLADQANAPTAQARAALMEADQAVIDKDVDRLEAALERARSALDEALAERPADTGLLRSRLVVTRRLANAATQRGKTPQASALLEEALSRAQVLFDRDKTSDRTRSDLLHVARELALVRQTAGQPQAAARAAGDAAAAVEAALAVLPGEASLQGLLAEVWLVAAEAHGASGGAEEAAAAVRAGAARAEAATDGGEDPIGALAAAYATLARAARIAARLRLPIAGDLERRCVRLLEQRKALAPDNAAFDRGLAGWHGRIGDREAAAGNDGTAGVHYGKAIELRRAAVQRDPEDADRRQELVRALNRLGAFHSGGGQNDAALRWYTEAVEAARPLGAHRVHLVALGNLAHVLGRVDRMIESKAAAAEAYTLAVALVEAGEPKAALDAAGAGLRHARLLRARPKPDRAAARAVVEAELARLVALGGEATKKRDAIRAGLEALRAELGR